jgi:DNA-binding MarR family transcriptional regulator
MTALNTDAREQILDAIRTIIWVSEQSRHATAEDEGVAMSDLFALSHLYARGPLSHRELAARVHLTGSAVTTVVDRLVARGYVVRCPDPADRRKSIVTLTEAGCELVTRTRGNFASFLELLPGRDLHAVADTLTDVADALRLATNNLDGQADAAHAC